MPDTIRRLHERLEEETDPHEAVVIVRRMGALLGHLSPHSSDAARNELVEALTPSHEFKVESLDVTTLRYVAGLMMRAVLRGQIQSEAYGTTEAMEMKRLQEEIMLCLHQMTERRSDEASMDGLSLQRLSTLLRQPVSKVQEALRPILFVPGPCPDKPELESNSADMERVTVERVDGQEYFVLAEPGMREVARILDERKELKEGITAYVGKGRKGRGGNESSSLQQRRLQRKEGQGADVTRT